MLRNTKTMSSQTPVTHIINLPPEAYQYANKSPIPSFNLLILFPPQSKRMIPNLTLIVVVYYNLNDLRKKKVPTYSPCLGAAVGHQICNVGDCFDPLC